MIFEVKLLAIFAIVQSQFADNPGVPLFLTPLIESGKLQDALDASRIHFNGFKNVESYSGYFTVDKAHNSNLFFWFFPAQNNYKTAPVILWLQGGPGTSSLVGLFAENGPFSVKRQKGLKMRPYSWTQSNSVIYIDNPVGAGFSFADNPDGYRRNQTGIATDLNEALKQFFVMFPELKQNEFYVAGESYAGKYVPAIAYAIHNTNLINLKGLAIGNGFTDPVNQLNHADYLYQLGLIDSNAKTTIQGVQNDIVKNIQGKNWQKAYELYQNLILNVDNRTSLISNLTGFDFNFNYMFTSDPSGEMDYIGNYFNRNDVRASIHVGNVTFSNGTLVRNNLIEDYMQSVAPWLVELLKNYKVLIYNGQLDMHVPYPLTVNYLQNLKFSSADEYKVAKRYQWVVEGDLAGYVKKAGNLTEILVRDAGLMVPQDQPKWAFDMISRFISDKPFH